MKLSRFTSKTNQASITTIFTVVVMLLSLILFLSSCGKEKGDVVVVAFDPETTYTMKAIDISTLVSDSGVTRYRMNAKTWLNFDKAKEPFYYFPDGIYIEKFDTLFNTEASIKADTAYYWTKKGLYKLINNVEIQNMEGEYFETSLLFWDEKEKRIWSDRYIRIQREDRTITGIGFESNQTMTNYKIFHSSGEFPVNDEASADSVKLDSDIPPNPLREKPGNNSR